MATKRSVMGFYEAGLFVDSIMEKSRSTVRRSDIINWYRRVHGPRAINAMLAAMLNGQHENAFRFANRMSQSVPSMTNMVRMIERGYYSPSIADKVANGEIE